jgi:hypothetical protein
MIAVNRLSNLCLRATDVSRQRRVRVEGVACDATVGELVQGLLSDGLRLPQKDAEGRSLTYRARLEREGRHLHATEIVGDTLQDEDEIVVQPHITAGA